ncbi:DUF5667 domain-containing protein [Nocardioides sp. SYSU DS0663]|uniref:DUF5667 domain-containing protein n=1 Tax=Nocardioides sp. SYSU DS0663 TaxID=3416445 RepID=UPI003F4C696C
MSPVFAARRRAEEFNSLVEGTSTRELHDTRTMELAELVGALRHSAPVEPRADFVSDLRGRLMAEAATALAPVGSDASAAAVDERLTITPRRSPRDRRIAAAVGGIAIVGATTSMAVAADSALPGETLYPLKRAIENVQTEFSVSPNQKGSTLLDNATGRLHEVQALSRSEEAPQTETTETISLTLATFMEQASEASDLLISDYEENGSADAIAQLRDFTASSMDALAGLESVLPDGARASLIQVAQLLTQIDAHAASLCTVCGGEGISVIPPFAVRAVEGIVGGLAGALLGPIEPVAAQEGQKAGGDQGGKSGTDVRKNGAKPGGQQTQQPGASTTTSPFLGGGKTDGPGSKQPGGNPSTLGDVVGGVVGGVLGGGGSSGSRGNTTSPPTTVPELLEDVVEGVGGVVGGVGGLVGGLLPPAPTTTEKP